MIPFKYKHATVFYKGLANVEIFRGNGILGYIDKRGEEIKVSFYDY
ncbi:MAG: hypothetical protein LBH59_04510 [Planctomycetaceae bacterium]|nr:hypothetical protein [Planctomycetaceae bacterium]